MSVDWKPNVKIEMAFKVDNELVPNLFSFLSWLEAHLIFHLLGLRMNSPVNLGLVAKFVANGGFSGSVTSG